jgi:hypothetical protein
VTITPEDIVTMEAAAAASSTAERERHLEAIVRHCMRARDLREHVALSRRYRSLQAPILAMEIRPKDAPVLYVGGNALRAVIAFLAEYHEEEALKLADAAPAGVSISKACGG